MNHDSTTVSVPPDLQEWSVANAAAVGEGRLRQADVVNVAHRLRCLATEAEEELRSRLRILIRHLMRWQYQPDLRGAAWRLTIAYQRREIRSLLKLAPSLMAMLDDDLTDLYRDAQAEAIMESAIELIPDGVLYSVEELLSGWMPPE